MYVYERLSVETVVAPFGPRKRLLAVGAVFGVGFFREWYTAKSKRRRAYLERKYGSWQEFLAASKQAAEESGDAVAAAFEEEELPRPTTEEIQRRRLVRRAHFTTIVAAWVITVPCAAALAVMLFWLIRLAA